MVRAWWRDVEDHGIEKTLLVAVRNSDRAALNVVARGVMRQAGRIGDDVVTAAGRGYAIEDRVMLLRNSSRGRYDNGDVGTVVGAEDGRQLVVPLDRGNTETLTASYLDAGQLDYAYAGTVYKAQGSTVETAHVLGTALAKEDGYVALSRGREGNRLYLVQGEPEAEIDLPKQPQRSAYAQAARSLLTSRAKELALNSYVWGEDSAALSATLSAAAKLLRLRPPSDAARLPALQAQLERLEAAGASPARVTVARAAVHAVLQGQTERDVWQAEHESDLAAVVSAGRELAWREKAAQTATLVDAAHAVPTKAVVGLDDFQQVLRHRPIRLND